MRRRTTALDGVTALVILLLMVQVWLLSATLDAFLAGHTDAALPGAVFSGMLGVTVFGILFTPVFYYVIRWFSRHKVVQAAPAKHVEKIPELATTSA